jgi:hypothetical protein
MTVEDGILTTVKGSTKLNSVALTGMTIRKIFKLELSTGGHTLIVGVTDSLNQSKWYYMKAADNELYEIKTTPGGASLTTSAHTARAKQVIIDNKPHMILVDGLQPVKIWESSGVLYYDVLEGTPPSGSYITTHRERVWMAKTNTLYYSNAYDPEDWSTAGETGEIPIESFDGDVIIEIANIFDDVIVFKKNSIWRISGDIPSEYSVERIYAVQGTNQSDGVCTDGNYSFYAAMNGIYRFDGTTGTPLLTDEIKEYYSKINITTAYKVFLILADNTLYFINKNRLDTEYYGKHLIYDMLTKKITVISMQNVLSTCYSENRLTGIGYLYYTDGSHIYYLDDTKLLYDTIKIAAYWTTPESDLGHPNAEKTITDMYFNAWGTDSAGTGVGQVKITATYKGMNGVQKTKEKIVTLSSTRRQHDIRFGITGRLFKFKFENVNGSAINLSGITLVCELAED